MKATELRKKTIEELKSTLSKLRRERFKLRLTKASGEHTETHQLKKNRRTVARIETILTEKEGAR